MHVDNLKLPAGGHVRANGIRQHYLRFGGRGPCVVVVPGIVSPAMLWAHVGQWLGEGADCLVLDVRGRGLSEAGPHLDYGVDACADDLVAFIGELQVEPPVVVGHSMGARIAARAAVRRPAAFRSLVLVDPPTSGPGRRPYPVPAERTLALLRAAHRGEALAAIRQGAARRWPPELERIRAEWLSSCDERVVAATYADFRGQDFFGDLAAARLPTSVICAGDGGVVSDADADELRALRSGVDVLRVPGVGHQMQAEDFPAFRLALAGVLRRHHDDFERISP